MISTHGTPAPSVLVIGESLIDVVNDDAGERRLPGGSPMNVAYGLARLGVDTRLLTRVGMDSDGEAIKRHVDKAGVTLLEESLDNQKTSVAVANIARNGSATYRFDVDWRLPSLTGLHLTNWIHVGSIATFLPPGADSLERFLSALKDKRPISYDPNIRPAMLGDRQLAVARFERIAGLVRVLKLSDEDAAWLYPALSEEFAIDRILTLGPEVVALTRGSAGARISTERFTVEVAAPVVAVVDTIGAGDSFMAALVSSLLAMPIAGLTTGQLRHIARLCVTAASLTCTRAGAEPPSLMELSDALYGQTNRRGNGALRR
jgi:fructokinase